MEEGEGAARLLKLAVRAADQPTAKGSGSYEYVRTRGRHNGSSHTQQPDGSLRLIESWVDPTERELWIAPDGSGRIEETRSGKRTDTSRIYGPGELHYFGPLPAEPNALEEFLAPMAKWGPYSWCNAFHQRWAGQVITPEVQSALLEVLATKPELTWEGRVSDPISRPGVAVSASQAELGKYGLIFDSNTGRLLASQSHYCDTDDNFTAWLDAGYVDSTDARP